VVLDDVLSRVEAPAGPIDRLWPRTLVRVVFASRSGAPCAGMAGHDDSRRLILVVEDVPGRYATLTPSLESAGYDVRTVALGSAALAAVAVRQPDAVLVRMGAMERDGIETCRRIRADPANRRMPVIALTDAPPSANARAFDAVAAGIDAGADDFVEPPFAEPLLLAAIRDALRMRRALAEMDAANVAALASAGDIDLDSADPTGTGMAGLARQLAHAAGIEGDELKGAVFGALVHDIGNLGIPDAILSKPGPLTDWERAEMRRHPEIGEGICRSFPSSRAFAPIVRHHHERWDGTGYPDGLQGDAIPIAARIVGLVDAFDAMVHDRPFRPAMTIAEALDEIRRASGRQFDPALVGSFLELVERPAGSLVSRS
jgi:putative two-component system response regulator